MLGKKVAELCDCHVDSNCTAFDHHAAPGSILPQSAILHSQCLLIVKYFLAGPTHSFFS
jgi:hypothetical protein